MENQIENQSRLLHFEDNNPAVPDLSFVNTSDALAWLKQMGFNLGEWQGCEGEEWEPTGMIEEKLDVYLDLEHVGQLIRLRETCPQCGRPDEIEQHRHTDENGELLGSMTYCGRCGHKWNINY